MAAKPPTAADDEDTPSVRAFKKRFEEMLHAGLVQEVDRLREEYGLDATSPAMKCVGYRQVLQHLDGELSEDELMPAGVAATRQLAKRQLTWLRSMNDVKAFECFDESVTASVLEYVRSEIARISTDQGGSWRTPK